MSHSAEVNTTAPRLIIGISACADSRDALADFMQTLTSSDDMAFLVVQPNAERIALEQLEPVTHLPVYSAAGATEFAAGAIYLCGAGDRFRLGQSEFEVPRETTARPVDALFAQLADGYGQQSAAIVLIGKSADGIQGLKAIKASGGLTLVQDPGASTLAEEIEQVIASDTVDALVKIEEMSALLRSFSAGSDHPHAREEVSPDDQPNLQAITDLLLAKANFNLAQYKPSTVQRRITRRMSLSGIGSSTDYLQRLTDSAEERELLTNDLLINITNFFRDPQAFQALEATVINRLVREVEDGHEIRVWVPGCASGEEVYSITILLLEALAQFGKTHPLRIFATDLDEQIIAQARKGQYAATIEEAVPGTLLNKYFTFVESDGVYRVNAEVRSYVSFAVQNVVSDPPFGHMHLISCRNLLIYLTKKVQERVIGAFYFSLKKGGYLFLGTSETTGDKKDLFKTIVKKWRIYQKPDTPASRHIFWNHQDATAHTVGRGLAASAAPARKPRETASRSDVFRRSLMDQFLPPAVVVDREGKILYNHGNWSLYLHIRSGEPTQNIVQLIVAPLRSRMRSALFKVAKTETAVSFRSSVDNPRQPGEKLGVRVEVAPLADADYTDIGAIGVVFYPDEREERHSASSLTSDDELKARLNIEQELAETREELQNTIEELETSTEELKASHEEALSTNEELQSANEELEASAAELRSLNEELSKLNTELNIKIHELQKANDDVENFFASTDLPTLFLAPSLDVVRYTPAAETLLKMGPSDIGRPFAALGRDLIDAELISQCRAVLQNFQPIRSEKTNYAGRHFIRQVTPYRTHERRVDGVVIVFQDVTELKRLSERASSREQQQAVVAKLGMLAISGCDPDVLMRQTVRQVVHTLNTDCCKILRYLPKENAFFLQAGVGWQDGLVGNATVPAGLDSQGGYTLIAKDPVIVRNFSEEKRFNGPQLLLDHDIVSGVSCVINHAEPPFGVIGVHSKNARDFSTDDANFLVSIANMLSAALRMKENQNELLEREAQFRSMANSIPQLAWMTDTTGSVQWYNQRWYDYTGASPEEMVGSGWQKVHHPEHLPRVLDKYKHSIAERSFWEDEFPLRGRDGNYRWFLSRAEPIFNLQGEVSHWFGTNTDITEMREQAQALADSKNKLRLAIDTNKIGFFEYYLREERTYWDPNIKSLWGLCADDTPTQNIFWQGIHPEDSDELSKRVAEATNMYGDGAFYAVYRVVNRQTSIISWVEACGRAIADDEGPLKMVGLVIDISERKRLEDSLKQAVKELQAADQSKNEFLSILGHELRNPLAALSGSVDILRNDDGAKQKILHVMNHSVTTMAKLLDDLLDLNRVSQNKIHLALKRIDLAELLGNVIGVTQNACYKKHQTLSLDAATPALVAGDPARLEQVFSNLILNASRYTQEGGTIKVLLAESERFFEVKVVDNGVGIKVDYIERIFDPFFQIKQDKQAASGLGIGLALAKKLVALHHGEIAAQSFGPNQGSTFTVRLPKGIADTIPALEQAAKVPVVKPGLRVLVVEDNENILATMPILLEHLGCEVQIAATGEEALRKTWIFQPEVMLVDIGLPDISGHQVAELLRRDGYRGLLIAVSGYSHTEIKNKSKHAGFDHHLAKPVTLSEITELLAGMTA